ncbi:hypothetical protein PWT90_10214 [Aphanocladium album]|nr:hypothetical protein PWT90_10214 [Aphanocladium album]
MKVISNARRYTSDKPSQQQHNNSSYRRRTPNFPSNRSARSPSPQVSPAVWNQQSMGASIEPSPPPTPQQEVHGEAHAPQGPILEFKYMPKEQLPFTMLSSCSNESRTASSQSTFESELSGRSDPKPGSPRSCDIPQSSATGIDLGPQQTSKKRLSKFSGPRVRDNGNALTVEHSEWPEGIPTPRSEVSMSPSEHSSASLEPGWRGNVGGAKGRHDPGKSSATVSHYYSTQKEESGVSDRKYKKRFGDEYKPCGLFTGSDLEERRRRDRDETGSSKSHIG